MDNFGTLGKLSRRWSGLGKLLQNKKKGDINILTNGQLLFKKTGLVLWHVDLHAIIKENMLLLARATKFAHKAWLALM